MDEIKNALIAPFNDTVESTPAKVAGVYLLIGFVLARVF